MRNHAHLAALAAATLCLFVSGAAGAQTAGAISVTDPAHDPYVQCSFNPQPDKCAALWKSSDDSNPASQSVKGAYEGYGRYLQSPAVPLTDQDRRYLADNAITLPDGLTSADQSGLHYVINDPGLAKDPAARLSAVNNYLNRAVTSELYCGFNSCGA